MPSSLSRRAAAVGLLLAAMGAPGLAAAGTAAATPLRVNTFPGFSYLVLYVAQAKGFFARRGLDVQIHVTLNSQEQREGLRTGAFQIAHGGVDNAVAVVEAAAACRPRPRSTTTFLTTPVPSPDCEVVGEPGS